ncbi:hypothetical protein MES4922_250067 [Mesorhizobium ventifaucium]|uniref:DUF2157 domain-containing protein n=1 Tax=Mesorhizobium ventifaucium TaxID=666020 RepID=A0ABM9DV35_9HYPH|nr:hypothetical protein MES4922_250067 [Mesorhizobium ventifaucium]
MASYSSRVRADITRWLQAGLIDASTADALKRDVEANERKSLSFGSILAVMAALLFGAAVLIFVAANWEAIPRLARVAALFAIRLCRRRRAEDTRPCCNRRGILDRRRSGIRRIDRADRPDVPFVRR